jgi:hypothetical protein
VSGRVDEFVNLHVRAERGYPWPEDSFGLTPMYGDDGWCRGCGMPHRSQSGSLVLQRKGLGDARAWVPNWRFDTICVEERLAEQLAARFRLDLRPVGWAGKPLISACQIVISTAGGRWFDPEGLRDAAIKSHGYAGETCDDCGRWRCMPLVFGSLPPLDICPGLGDLDVAASPEWFGVGKRCFRQVLVRRELAEAIAAAAPHDFRVQHL